MYCQTPQQNCSHSGKHTEEGEKRRKLDAEDRQKVNHELKKHSHPLETESSQLYNIVNGQVAPANVNVHESFVIGEEMSKAFDTELPLAFHKKITKQVKTMQNMKKSVVIKGMPVYDMEAIFARLLVVGQQRGIDLKDVFQHELSPVPPALIDEFGCLRKGDKSALVKRLGCPIENALSPDVLLVDASQLLYHVVWPVSGGLVSFCAHSALVTESR